MLIPKHCPVTSPSANQRIVHKPIIYPVTTLPHLAFKNASQSSCCGSVVTKLTSIHENTYSIPGPDQWVRDLALPAVSCGVGCRCGLDLALLWLWLWLWHRPSAAALIQLLAQELPYVVGTALKRSKKKKKLLKPLREFGEYEIPTSLHGPTINLSQLQTDIFILFGLTVHWATELVLGSTCSYCSVWGTVFCYQLSV